MSATADSGNQQGAQLRRETLNGTEYLVAPVVAIREGVYMYPRQNGRGIKREFLPAEEIANTTPKWEDIPLTLAHPKDDEGRPGLTDDPDTTYANVGLFRNVANEEDALIGETWIEAAEVGEHGGKLENYVNAVEAGNPQEVSTGYRAGTEFDRGKYENQRYTYVQREPEPDHLALLPDNRGNCSVAEGCGAGQVVNQMPFASDDGVRVNNRRMTTNVTPEQVEIVQEIIDQFTQSQGSATLAEMHTWIRENEDLDADDKTAMRAALDEVFDQDPGEWRVDGEFSAWLDRRAEQGRENTLDDISEPAGILSVDEGSSDKGSDTAMNLLRSMHANLKQLVSGEEPQGDVQNGESGEAGSGEANPGNAKENMSDTIEKLVNEHGLSRENAEALEGTQCAENILNAFESAEDADSDGGEEETQPVANEEIEQRFNELEERFESKLEDKENRIEELETQVEEERNEREEQLNQRLKENTELGEETIEGMALESKQNLAEDLGVEDETEQEEQVNMAGIPGQQSYDFEVEEDDGMDIPVPGSGGRANEETAEEGE